MVAVVSRATYACYEVQQISPQVLATVPFEQEAANIAMALATGKGFSSPMRRPTGPTAWLPPVYPFLLAGIFSVFGVFTLHAFYAAAGLNIFFSAVACVPIYFAGKKIAGLGAASLAAWLWALFPNAIMIPFQWIWDTSLSALLAATILWAVFELDDSQSLSAWCAYGVLWGLALLTNPAVAAALPFVAGWQICRARKHAGQRAAIARPSIALALAILCCLPWTIRNYAEFHRFIPVRSNFPFDLWIGNNEVFDDRSPDINARVTRYEQERRYVQLGEPAFMQEKWNLATQFIRTHKALELRLTAWRFLSFWLGSFRPLQDFQNADSLWIRAIFILNLLTAAGGALGLLVLWRARRPYLFPPAAFLMTVPLVYYVTHASLRYRHPIDPIVLLLTGIALAGVTAESKKAKDKAGETRTLD